MTNENDRMSVAKLEQTLSRAFGVNLGNQDFPRDATSVARLAPEEKRQLVRLLSRGLGQAHIIRDTQSRVALCRLLCASVPESEATIRRLLRVGGDRNRYEVQFSLFCFLDRVLDVDNAHDFAEKVPGLIENYLLNVREETALAAWMAAHMLAGHWSPKTTSTTVLVRVLKTGRYSAGRLAALTGLKEILVSKVSPGIRSKLRDAILQAATEDRSEKVRLHARSIVRSNKVRERRSKNVLVRTGS